MKKKTALITGGSKGIGKAISVRLAKSGHNVVVNYSNDDVSAGQTLLECVAAGGEAILIKADVSDEEQVNQMFCQILSAFGGIDVVVNNAGLNIDKPVLDLSGDEWDRVVDVNMKGVFLVSKAAAKMIRSRRCQGHIINVSASTGIAGRKNGVNYCASKAGVIVMSKCLAKELGPDIRVNCLIPGITRTEETEKRFNLKENEHAEVQRRSIPLNRIGEPEDIANFVNFLISDEASYLNGQKFIVDGGEYMY
jgi:3-oxoacyl-[acyl-carrier protein] reductase